MHPILFNAQKSDSLSGFAALGQQSFICANLTFQYVLESFPRNTLLIAGPLNFQYATEPPSKYWHTGGDHKLFCCIFSMWFKITNILGPPWSPPLSSRIIVTTWQAEIQLAKHISPVHLSARKSCVHVAASCLPRWRMERCGMCLKSFDFCLAGMWPTV